MKGGDNSYKKALLPIECLFEKLQTKTALWILAFQTFRMNQKNYMNIHKLKYEGGDVWFSETIFINS